MTTFIPKHKLALVAGTLSLSVLLSACGDSSSSSDDNSQLRVIHASSDAPAVNVRVDSNTAIADLDYAESSGYLEVRTGTRSIVVEAIVPSGTVDVITVDRFEIEEDERYNIIAINDVVDIAPLVVAESATDPADDEVAIAVVHAATVAPAVDVYVTAPDALLNGTEPTFSFDFQGVVDAGALPVGTYRIRVALQGEADPDANTVYDSGPVDLTPFAGAKLLAMAINTENATEEAASPVKVLVATDSAQVTLLDSSTNSGLRVLHLSPDAPPVDIFANAGKLITALAYTETFPGTPTASSYDTDNVPAGDYAIDVAVSAGGTTVADSIYNANVSLESGMEYSVVALGNVADGLTGPGDGTAFGLLPIVDHNRAIATQASVQILHGAPAAGAVDVYVTAGGAFTDADVLGGLAGDPLLDGFAFGELTDYVALAPNSTGSNPEGYDIRIVPEATGTIAIKAEGVQLPPGVVATVIARQPATGGGAPTDFNLVVLTN